MVVGATACGRDKTSTTTTTSSETPAGTEARYDEPEKTADQIDRSAKMAADDVGRAAGVASDEIERAVDDKTATPLTAGKTGKKAKGPETRAAQTKTTDDTEDVRDARDAEEPVGVTTITQAEVVAPTPPPTATPAPAPAPTGDQGYVNRSTVLGNGQSGTYTDGQGTYGGRATWGTGVPK
ncbi:MAG: hypothetical protein KIT84_36045 [Labilithrix sp.]|nr:hypothetical protein [Labilithrix sp.]MCW5816466.1 hypothetical protein [Labilithrix sp.]